MAITTKCFKILILIYLVFLALAGFAILCINSVLLYQLLKNKSFTESHSTTAIILIGVNGLFCCIVSRIGWRVVYNPTVCRVIMFGIFALSLACLSFGYLIWILTILHSLKDEVTKTIYASFEASKENENYMKTWEKIQSESHCCGVAGPSDYHKSRAVPWSCCKKETNNEINVGECSSLYMRGCLLPVYDEVYDTLLYSGLSSLALAFIQFLGAILYFYLAKVLKKLSSEEERLQSSAPEDTRRELLNQRIPKY